VAEHILARLDELVDGGARRFDVAGHRIAVVRIGADVYAIGDECSHADYSLSEGEVDSDERTLECPKHWSMFDLCTGEPLTMPATRPVPVYDVSVRDGAVVVELEATAARGQAAASGTGPASGSGPGPGSTMTTGGPS